MTRIKRPFVRYPGSKIRLYDWLSQFIPKTADSYNEPYFGSGVTLFLKSRHPLEAVTDKNDDVVNAFQQLRDNTDALVEAIKRTPWAYSEFVRCKEPTNEPLERARRFYARCWMSIKPFDNQTHFRRQRVLSKKEDGTGAMTGAARLFMQTDHLYEIASRLRGVTIENREAIPFIKLYDHSEAFFYLDPPYVPSTIRKNHYKYAMTEDDHRELGEVLLQIKGMAVISGYASDLYRDIFEANGWVRYDSLPVVTQYIKTRKVESVWVCPKTQARLTAEKTQNPLFCQYQLL